MSDTLVLNRDGMPMSMLPISALSWQDAIKAVYVGALKVVHEYEDWQVRSPSTIWRVPAVVMAKSYVTETRNAHYTPQNLLLRDRHTCQYCGKRFPAKDLTKDHVIPKVKGGRTSWDNVVAACGPCNTRKGDKLWKPLTPPRRPTYYELIERAKEHTLIVPHESWVYYLGWPEERLQVVSRRFAWIAPKTTLDEPVEALAAA